MGFLNVETFFETFVSFSNLSFEKEYFCPGHNYSNEIIIINVGESNVNQVSL